MAMFYFKNRYYRRSIGNIHKTLVVVGVIACCVVLFLRVPPFVARFVYSGVYGVTVVSDAMRDEVEYAVLMEEEKDVLAQEVQRLRKELSVHEYDTELVTLLARERDMLLAEVGAPTATVSVTHGTVVGYRRLFTNSFIIVSVPPDEASSVSVGGGAETLAGVPVGIVREVFDRVAIVTPYSGMSEPFAVRFSVGSTTVHTEAVGRGIATVVAHVPRDVPIAIGTPVYVEGSRVPFGVVQEHASVPENAEQDLYIHLAADIRSLSHVRFTSPVVFVETTSVSEL